MSIRKVVASVFVVAFVAFAVVAGLIYSDIQRLHNGNISTRVVSVSTYPAPEMDPKPVTANIAYGPLAMKSAPTVTFNFGGDTYERVEISLFGKNITNRVANSLLGSQVNGTLYRLKLCGNWTIMG